MSQFFQNNSFLCENSSFEKLISTTGYPTWHSSTRVINSSHVFPNWWTHHKYILWRVRLLRLNFNNIFKVFIKDYIHALWYWHGESLSNQKATECLFWAACIGATIGIEGGIYIYVDIYVCKYSNAMTNVAQLRLWLSDMNPFFKIWKLHPNSFPVLQLNFIVLLDVTGVLCYWLTMA